MFNHLKKLGASSKGLTLLEIIIVIVIIGIFSAAAVQYFGGQDDAARVSTHSQNVSTLESAVDRYSMEIGMEEDTSFEDLRDEGYIREIPVNPWGDDSNNHAPAGWDYEIERDGAGIYRVYLTDGDEYVELDTCEEGDVQTSGFTTTGDSGYGNKPD